MDECKLYDLIEYRWDRQRDAFVKVATLKTNVPAAIAYVAKAKAEFLFPRSRSTRFKVVRNGARQYSNRF